MPAQKKKMTNPKIEEGKYYKVKIKYFGRELEYYCKIKWIRGNTFKIVDESDHKLIFKLADLFYAKEIPKEKVEKEYKPVWIKGIIKKSEKEKPADKEKISNKENQVEEI